MFCIVFFDNQIYKYLSDVNDNVDGDSDSDNANESYNIN